MPFRIATFNVENLMNRFDFSGFRNQLLQDRALSLFEIRDEADYRQLEMARVITHADDARQLSALGIAAARADIVCLQEVENLAALQAFEYGYLYKMIGEGYRHKYTTPGNDGRGIDVAIMLRDETADGQAIEVEEMISHAHLTFAEMGLHNPSLAEMGVDPASRIFRRDCLELRLRIGGVPLTVYCVHFKSMGPPREGLSGRMASMPIRIAEASAVRRIVKDRFGERAAGANWIVAGDFNDYSERVLIRDDGRGGHDFEVRQEAVSSVEVLTEDGFSENLVERRPALDRWTLYHTRGPKERHLCQLDYLLASPALARINRRAVPDIIRNGQPWRTIFPPGQEVERYPRTGWDRPKASDHCPVAVTLSLL
jgi:predicted extracellular nuclease